MTTFKEKGVTTQEIHYTRYHLPYTTLDSLIKLVHEGRRERLSEAPPMVLPCTVRKNAEKNLLLLGKFTRHDREVGYKHALLIVNKDGSVQSLYIKRDDHEALAIVNENYHSDPVHANLLEGRILSWPKHYRA